MYNPRLHFHFTGIGGSGMCGLAEILLNLGFKVSGSDLKPSAVTAKLETLGAVIRKGHAAENLPTGASLLVFSSAVTQNNPELVEARSRGIPVVRRAEVLAELMRLKFGVAVGGSHGKTTTTSMTAAILEHGGLDPTVIIGGQVKASDSGSRLGKSDYLVAETDESDRSFLLLKPTIAVVTNIDAEHLSAYKSLAELEESFEQFVRAVPFYGLAVLCIDDRRVRELATRYSLRKVTYGYSPDADLQPVILAQEPGKTTYEVFLKGEKLLKVTLPMPGRHLVLNSLAAIAVGLEFEIPPAVIAEALASFSGVKRRLEVVGSIDGVTVMNDYGHHPTEVRATLRAIREGWGTSLNRLHVIFQPHRYTRTKECFVDFLESFQDADRLLMTDIYAASEEPIEGVSGRSLCEAVVHPHKEFLGELDSVVPRLSSDLASGDLAPGDIVLCLGAGSVGQLPEQLLEMLKERGTSQVGDSSADAHSGTVSNGSSGTPLTASPVTGPVH